MACRWLTLSADFAADRRQEKSLFADEPPSWDHAGRRSSDRIDCYKAGVSSGERPGTGLSTLTKDSGPQQLQAGDRVTGLTGPGSLICIGCGYGIAIDALDALPECPACGGSRFRRGSLFDQPTVDVDAADLGVETPNWIEAARGAIAEPGPHLAFDDDGETVTISLAKGWTRIGRSDAADIQLDDPTVSRRHALIVHTPEGDLRALDDRSLNGLFVNGRRVDWAPLSDGDELEIGRYRLFVLSE